MCGIVGIIGKTNVTLDKVFTNLLVMDAVRGFDGVGIASVKSTSNKIESYKNACDVATFINTKHYEDVLGGINKVLIGHNRWATKGGCTSLNAHPFQHSGIIGVHNGTIRTQSMLPDHKLFEVDSDNVYYSIAEKGIEWTWKNLDGAAALVWWDADAKTVNFIRNDERPLWYVQSKDNKNLFFASEYHMIYAATARHDVDTGEYAYPFEPNTLYTIDMTDAGKEIEFTQTKLEPCEKKTYNRSGYPYNSSTTSKVVLFTFDSEEKLYYEGTAMSDGVACKVYKSAVTQCPITKFEPTKIYSGELINTTYMNGEKTYMLKAASVKEVNDDAPFDHNGEFLSMADFFRRYDKCSECQSTLFYEDDNMYTGEHTAVCEECMKFYQQMGLSKEEV